MLAVAIFTLVYTVTGFGLLSATNDTAYSRLSWPVLIHAALMVAWLVLYARQIALKRSGDVARHRRHGQWVVALGAGIVASGLYITWRAAPELGGAQFLVLNSVGFLVFGVLVSLAVRAARKHRYDAHKRFMLVATLTFLGPASIRVAVLLGLPPPLGALVMVAAVVLVPFAFDRIDCGRWQRASKIAAAIVIAGLIGGGVLPFSPAIQLFEPLVR